MKQYPLPENFKDKTELAFELKKIVNSLIDTDDDTFKNYNELIDFAKKLKIKYKDAGQHYLYHLIIGSSLNKEDLPKKFDFEGEDSVEKFLRSKKV
ncbi:MAG: hypothetical protein M1155_01215 [Patescibacteria group bacterium]|nr:hypothetical protein [Patescibacteria group bacterium]